MRALLVCAGAVLFATTAPAYAADNPEALDELKQGYALKQVGNCRDALPHFAHSAQLQSTARTWLNISDCEQQLGDLVSAQGHAAQGRELARQRNDTELVGIADQQLAAIDGRLPRLTIRLSAQAPAGSKVQRDGVAVDRASLGSPMPVNPGAHIITVSASGRGERRFDVTVAEGGRNELAVEPGPKLGLEPPAKVTEGESPSSPERAGATSAGPYKPLAIASFAVGGVGLVTGLVAGLMAGSRHDLLTSECPGDVCPPTATSAHGDLDAFHTLRTVSTVGYVVGALGVGAGVVLWLVAPSHQPTTGTASVWVGPGSAGIGGRF